MAISKRTRFEVLRRDNYTCRYCRSAENALTVDHVTPLALGGTDEPTNLVACCTDCNSGKGSSSPDAETVAQVADDAIRWQAAMQQAAAVMDEQVSDRDAYVAALIQTWPQYRNLPESVIQTAERMHALGLPRSVMVDAARAAATNRGVNDRASYFAGICWKRVRAMQEIAQQIVTAGDADA